ncbi:hypothetical protein, partial [Rhodopirellula bahusiensis]|uniref:hypothetical protein n=2 Tax=Rhodopirellula bahusiensis TaxID=2014065 RepID=UPI003298359D
WFGDGPVRRRRTSRMFTEFSVKRFYEMIRWARGVRQSRRMFAWALSGCLVSTASVGVADEPMALTTPDAHVASLPSGFFAAAGFAMIDDDDVADAAVESSSDAEPVNADEARRQRLRDLLRNDTESDRAEANNGKDRMSLRDEIIADAKEEEKDGDGMFAQPFISERLPDVTDGRIILPSLRAVSLDTSTIGNGRLPDDFDSQEDAVAIPLPEEPFARGMVAAGTVLPWTAPNTYSHPLYFEDRMLERHGHERWGCMQPIAAGARFFTTIPMLPYLATIQEPCDIVYSKGYFRAGSSAPCVMQRPPLERRAVVVEAAAIAGGIIALP